MCMSFIFMYTFFSLQRHICLLQGAKVCTRTCYFNACLFFDAYYVYVSFVVLTLAMRISRQRKNIRRLLNCLALNSMAEN